MTRRPENLEFAETVEETRVALCLGSNLGDRAATIRQAADMLGGGTLRAPRLSSMLENEPWDCAPDAPAYLNAALVGRTLLTPRGLLAACLSVERQLGRDRSGGHHADRTIDIDIVLFGETRVTEQDLTIPHPGLATRAFFLIPLAEIAADWRVPGLDKTVGHLLRDLPDIDCAQ
jgi:2-amino-4-hydroxy-6-hydroxymethyldihydropteridine diphosphokinase